MKKFITYSNTDYFFVKSKNNYLCAGPVVGLSVMVNVVHCMPRHYSLEDIQMDIHRSCPLTLNLSQEVEMSLANSMSPLCDWRLCDR